MVAKRTKEILRRLDEVYTTEYKCYLEHDSAWQLLIATILSAQCTDARVNIVTKDLFRKYPTIEAFAGADVDELEQVCFARSPKCEECFLQEFCREKHE